MAGHLDFTCDSSSDENEVNRSSDVSIVVSAFPQKKKKLYQQTVNDDAGTHRVEEFPSLHTQQLGGQYMHEPGHERFRDTRGGVLVPMR